VHQSPALQKLRRGASGFVGIVSVRLGGTERRSWYLTFELGRHRLHVEDQQPALL
jgi:hypothetical protein